MRNFILKDENAVFYECGYSCDNEIYISICGENFFITDARYSIEARQNIKNAQVIEIQSSLIKEARLLLRKLGIKNLYFNPNDFTFMQYSALSSNLDINFIAKPNFSQIKRMIKKDFEIDILRNAARTGAYKFDELANFLNKNLNLSEEEINFHTQNILKDSGKLGLSFEPITAINSNAAKAHAMPTKLRLQKGDLLLVDAGVKFKRYCSDRTRTINFENGFKFDKNQKFKDSKKDEIFNIVKEAQAEAIKAVKPGIAAYEVDRAARDYIAKFGYEKEFFHSTGHGVGLDIHELPIISKNSQTILEEGMVFSVEPGIYIENEFGIRTEDVVVVTKDGCEVL
ncbi:M24 family metallopeptidase [Campylobacter fetus]|nr:M24 family metallopeptidase [Campylobacter fetus]EJU9540827.1 M24 family metallopeptidase [Campylobacter fetus]